MILAMLARRLPPRSWCVGCGRPWFTDKRRPCSCGETGRAFRRSAHDGFTTNDKAN